MLKLYSLSGGTTKDPRLQLFKKRNKQASIGTKYRKPIKLIDASKIIVMEPVLIYPSRPIQQVDVGGSGDCFYRCISYFLFNNPELHLEIRNNLADWMVENRIQLSTQLMQGIPLHIAIQSDVQSWNEFIEENFDNGLAKIIKYAEIIRIPGVYAEGQYDYYCLIRMIKEKYNKNVKLNFYIKLYSVKALDLMYKENELEILQLIAYNDEDDIDINKIKVDFFKALSIEEQEKFKNNAKTKTQTQWPGRPVNLNLVTPEYLNTIENVRYIRSIENINYLTGYDSEPADTKVEMFILNLNQGHFRVLLPPGTSIVSPPAPIDPTPTTSFDSSTIAEDFSKLKLVELKDRLRALKLPVSGRKADLLERLQDATNITAPLEKPASRDIETNQDHLRTVARRLNNQRASLELLKSMGENITSIENEIKKLLKMIPKASTVFFDLDDTLITRCSDDIKLTDDFIIIETLQGFNFYTTNYIIRLLRFLIQNKINWTIISRGNNNDIFQKLIAISGLNPTIEPEFNLKGDTSSSNANTKGATIHKIINSRPDLQQQTFVFCDDKIEQIENVVRQNPVHLLEPVLANGKYICDIDVYADSPEYNNIMSKENCNKVLELCGIQQRL